MSEESWCGETCAKCKYTVDECRVGYEHALLEGRIDHETDRLKNPEDSPE